MILSEVETLAAKCLVNAGLLTQRLQSQEGATGPQADKVTRDLRLGLFEAAQSLLQSVTPPEYALTQQLSGSIMDLTAFRYISRFSVAKAVPIHGSITYEDLATTLKVDKSQLKRVLRYAMTKRIFFQTQSGEVAHTETSLLLVKGGVSVLNSYSSERGFPVASCFNEALDKWGHGSQEPNETAFNVFHETELPMFDYYEENPASGAPFHQVMQHFTKTPALSHEHIKTAFDWKSLSHTTVIDIGGSLGHASVAILESNPTLSCIVQDLPKPVAQATNPSTSIVPEHMAKRISFQEHSFWDTQKVSADVYFMRMIFHDWSDKYAVKILQALLPAMRPGAKLLIMDYVTRPYGTLKSGDERRMRMRDMQMMIMHNALERDEEEWKNLFAQTDRRLRLVDIHTPPGSALSLIELVLDGEVDVKTEAVVVESPVESEKVQVGIVIGEKTEKEVVVTVTPVAMEA
ncbi:hypothetical protein PV11_04048 [Exophiala sideris]|uniref:O-methyltransferase C-terminal domain-containing protein n=1 Tax=Exophiala sideris TaxID=1016849 RepID=A0A0D1YLF9_9EURO|nr:hypothetical protein PV11_04048 [Exophiala sideris]